MDIDCILTIDVDYALRKFVQFVRIKRQKFLCFRTSLPVRSLSLPQNPPQEASSESIGRHPDRTANDWDGENDWSSWLSSVDSE